MNKRYYYVNLVVAKAKKAKFLEILNDKKLIFIYMFSKLYHFSLLQKNEVSTLATDSSMILEKIQFQYPYHLLDKRLPSMTEHVGSNFSRPNENKLVDNVFDKEN